MHGFLYRKTYTLRGMGDNVEVWVASEDDRRRLDGATPDGHQDFPRRRLPQRRPHDDHHAQVRVPDRRVRRQHAPEGVGGVQRRSGPRRLPRPARAAVHPQGDGDNTVVLVDNVRDDNFYDFNNTQGFSYIAGFFSSQLNNLFDRNVMTIDAFDWLHRTGANPPHEPVPGNNCTSAPARPFLYEGVFAHEYQHLL